MTLSAQDLTVQQTTGNRHYVGFSLGSITGMGFSYRYHPEKWGYQLTLLPPIGDFDNPAYSLGGAFLYRVDMIETNSLLINIGGSYTNFMYEEGINLGIQTGFESGIDNIKVVLMGGYGAYGIGSDYPRLFISAELGIYYSF